MDGQKFDDITRALATGTSRRRVLKGLLAGAVGVVGLRRAAKVSAGPAGTRVLGESCRETADCTANQNLECQKVAETGAFRCECATGFISCQGQCVSINCPGGGQLDTTTCTCVCPTGTELCNNSCVQSCTSPFVLNTSSCACECPSSTPELCNGACYAACAPGFTRNATTCACECPSGTELCGGQCVTVCPTGFVRNSTTCQCVCPTGQEVCQNACYDLCEDGEVRNPTTCACGCPSGTVLCNGACVSNVCPSGSGQTFNETTCSCTCAPNEVFCGGRCHDPNAECAGLHNKIFNVDCCNQGSNPCQNPGQPSGRCKA